jgi:hypothetical protein
MKKEKEKEKTGTHISDFVDLPDEVDLDFFDINLEEDTILFIDPFLLKKSKFKKEQELFDRFGDYFRYIYEESINMKDKNSENNRIMRLLNFTEPKEIGLGYSEKNSEGSSPGKKFASLLIKFFINSAARRLIKEDSLYPEKKFNPYTIEIFTDRFGVDGLSDITANLIMDYLIDYTQKQSKKYMIPMKELAFDNDGFDFDPDVMNWRGGNRYLLPENPLKKGVPIILVPKRLLRSGNINKEDTIKKALNILKEDSELVFKFSDLLGKKIKNVSISEIRKLFLEEHSLFKKYMFEIEKDKSNQYDFNRDPLEFLSRKKYSEVFKDLEEVVAIDSHENVYSIGTKFIELVQDHLSKTEIWKNFWIWDGKDIKKPNTEKSLQKIIHAMSKSYFYHYPDLTFIPEVGTGNGSIDFSLIYKDCRIAIECKRLLSENYLHGMEVQLVDYVDLLKATHAIYVTIQHYTKKSPRSTGRDDDIRVTLIEKKVSEVKDELVSKNELFKKLSFYNINVGLKETASKKKRVN